MIEGAPQIEIVKADYFDEETVDPSPYVVKRMTYRGGRIYVRIDEKKGKVAYSHSVTTILGEECPSGYGITEWYGKNGLEYCKWFVEMSAHYGTFMHMIFSWLISGRSVKMRDLDGHMAVYCVENEVDLPSLRKWVNTAGREPRKDIIGFLQWVQDYKAEPVAVELPLWSKNYSGVVDLVFKSPGYRGLCMVDWKTGYENYLSHQLQLVAYRNLWNEEYKKYPDRQVKHIFNYHCKNYRIPIGKTVTPYTFIDHTKSPNLHRWGVYLKLFLKDKKGEVLKPLVEYYEGEVTTQTDLGEMYKTVDPVQKIVEYLLEKEAME